MILPEDVHRRIGETAPEGLWVLDGAGRTVHVSAQACELLGRSESALAGANPIHLVDVEHPEGMYGLLTALFAGRSVPDVHARVRLRGGRERELTLRGRFVDDADADASRLAVLWLAPISDHERLQEELAFQRDELIEAQQLARMASWRLDLDTQEVTWSEAMFELMGRDRAAGPMTLREVVERVEPVDRDLIYAAREETYRAGKLDVTFRYLHPDAGVTWLRCRGAVRSVRGGQSNVLLSCLLDITQQKEIELALTVSAQLAEIQRALASQANRSATVAEALDRMLDRGRQLDPHLRLITFQPIRDTKGVLVLDPSYPGRRYEGAALDHDQPTEREWACARRAVETGTVVIAEYDDLVEMGHCAVYDGEIFVVVVITTTNSATPDHIRRNLLESVSGQLTRVAERERTNAALAAARDEALEASRHKSEFLATMSHEIRTPLNGVIGLNELLLRSDLDTDQRRIAEGVQVAGQTLLTVINDILDFSKIEAGRLELESVDFILRDVVDGAAGLLGERAHEHGIELAASVRGDVPEHLRGDPTRLAQILTNLISNAVKFTAEGEVVVSCEPVAEAEEDGEVVVLRFAVRDTGIGIPPEKISGLFDAFAQAEMSTTRRYGGTGLGLAICRQLVAALGGEIGVNSTIGEGSTFWFTARFLKAEAGGPLAGQRGHVLRGRRALVVDDNGTNRAILAEVLHEWDMEVDQADDVSAATEILRSASRTRKPVEIVLVDYRMPGTDGLTLASRVSEDDQVPTPIMLLLLSSAESVDRRRMVGSGVTMSLTKPVARSALFDALVNSLAERHGLRQVGPPPGRPRSRPTGKHLLLVEDNEINQMVALGVLDHLGYTVDVAPDGVEAVEMALRKPYDAILMDVQMPRMDGYEATEYIRSQEQPGQRTPIIAMTAAALDTERDRSLAVGMDDFLTKPLEVERLERTLHSWLAGPEPESEPDVAARPAPIPDRLLDRSRVDTLRKLGERGAALAAAGLASFSEAAPREVHHLRSALEENDRERLRFVAHRLRGSAANLGAVAVADLSREIEELIDQGAVPDGGLIGQLEKSVEATVQEIALLDGYS